MNSPPDVLATKVCASGSRLPICVSEEVTIPPSSVSNSLLSVTSVTSILPFLVAMISSWIVLKIPVEENNAWANVSGCGSVWFELEDVNLNSLSPVLNFGLPAVFGSGNWNKPLTSPPPSVINAPPSEPPAGVTKEATLTLSKKG